MLWSAVSAAIAGSEDRPGIAGRAWGSRIDGSLLSDCPTGSDSLVVSDDLGSTCGQANRQSIRLAVRTAVPIGR
jgi:hypothetical protein